MQNYFDKRLDQSEFTKERKPCYTSFALSIDKIMRERTIWCAKADACMMLMQSLFPCCYLEFHWSNFVLPTAEFLGILSNTKYAAFSLQFWPYIICFREFPS